MTLTLLFSFEYCDDYQVSEEDIESMFSYADRDGDGKISYQEFQVMINPPPVNTEIQSQRKASKRVTIQATEPEILSVTNFSYQETQPFLQPDQEHHQESWSNNQHHWDMENSDTPHLEY